MNIFIPEYAPTKWLGYFDQIQIFQNMGPLNWGMDFLVAKTTFSKGFLVALNTIE